MVDGARDTLPICLRFSSGEVLADTVLTLKKNVKMAKLSIIPSTHSLI